MPHQAALFLPPGEISGLELTDTNYVQQFDSVPQFWQFLGGLRFADLIVELIQNELDANASRTSITFTHDRLVCEGDGEPVSEDGWERLSYVMGAGDQVDSKHFRIGVKNHGLKACFKLGDEIILRSDGYRMIQTLYKDGPDNHPSPGTLPKPIPDNGAPIIGCSVEVPYRRKELVVSKGEDPHLEVVDEKFPETLFRNACNLLPGRLLGVVHPETCNQYTLCLNHHTLGSVAVNWQAKRGRNINGRGRRQFLVFSRECKTSSNVPGIPSKTIREQACSFRVPFPAGERSEIPHFFVRDKRSFRGEIAWIIDKKVKPKATRGVRRYPIGYDGTSEAALTGVGVHFSGPYISDSERHGASQVRLNNYIDNACKDALVEIMASYLLHRHGGKAMELYMIDPASPGGESLSDLVDRTIARRALPLRDKVLRESKRSRRLALGPRRTSRGGSRRVVLPMFKWDDDDRFSLLLSEICPKDEDQIDRMVPQPILSCIKSYMDSNGNCDRVITFDEDDAILRLQPNLKSEWFSWKDESEWRTALGDPSVAKKYLDVIYETTQKGELASEQQVVQNAYMADRNCTARPLSEMFSTVSLPANLGDRESVPILHPELQNHRLLKRVAWKPERFTLDNYLDKAQLETASLNERKSFWTWFRNINNWKTVERKTRARIAKLPVWPSSDGSFLLLKALCEPANARVASVMGDAICRPSRELLNAGLVRSRDRLTFRTEPNIEEVQEFLSVQLGRFGDEGPLSSAERREFHKFESDLAVLASRPQLKTILTELSYEFAVALSKDGNLCPPHDLIRSRSDSDRAVSALHLPPRHVIDRLNNKLDCIEGWGPRQNPTTAQIVDALSEDGTRTDAHVPRLQEYVRQAEREGVQLNSLIDLPCIPVAGNLYSPSQIALRGRRNFWGDWKIEIPLTGVNAQVQKLYRKVGVVGGEPDSRSSSSKNFFQWLASQNPVTIAKHIDQVLRHIGHNYGPRIWGSEFPYIPFIPVESDVGRVQLVTVTEATKRRSKVVIPDFKPLAEAIRQSPGKHPVDMVLVERRRVTEPITAYLRELGLRTLSDLAGEPIQVIGRDGDKLTHDVNFRCILDSLLSGMRGRQLRKRLERIDLDGPKDRLRSNWREHLQSIQSVKIADSVTATYKLGRIKFPIPVDGKLDEASRTLWLKSDSDLQESFFDVIAEHIFERPQKYHGSVLERAYKMDMRDHSPLEFTGEDQSFQDVEFDETTTEDREDETLSATSGVHPAPKSDPSSNVPSPEPIPTGPGSVSSRGKSSRGVNRPQSATENAQVENLKKKQYAWHCQVCIAGMEPNTLAPSSSYAAIPLNRSPIMQAHHCDHVSAGGARHVGNILLLCRYHHLALGDAVSRAEVTQAFSQASSRSMTFNSDNGVSNSLEGKIITFHPPQRQSSVSLFFTTQHADFWLKKAKEEGLI